MIGKAVDRSEKAVRGKVYFTYLTENADKGARHAGRRPMGAGAPEPTVRQGFNLSRTRTEVRKNLSILDAILRKRMNDLGWDDFWQRGMLPALGQCPRLPDEMLQTVTAAPSSSGSGHSTAACVPESFWIVESRSSAPKCRAMRKKQAQRKYAVLRSRGQR